MASNKEAVKLTGPTKIAGRWHEAGDSVDVYPFQRRHMIQGGYAEGGVDKVFSEGEKDAGAMEVLKRASDRDVDVWSVDKVFAENDEGSSSSDPKKSRSESK